MLVSPRDSSVRRDAGSGGALKKSLARTFMCIQRLDDDGGIADRGHHPLAGKKYDAVRLIRLITARPACHCRQTARDLPIRCARRNVQHASSHRSVGRHSDCAGWQEIREAWSWSWLRSSAACAACGRLHPNTFIGRASRQAPLQIRPRLPRLPSRSRRPQGFRPSKSARRR
jgi:hypothetical protein